MAGRPQPVYIKAQQQSRRGRCFICRTWMAGKAWRVFTHLGITVCKGSMCEETVLQKDSRKKKTSEVLSTLYALRIQKQEREKAISADEGI